MSAIVDAAVAMLTPKRGRVVDVTKQHAGQGVGITNVTIPKPRVLN